MLKHYKFVMDNGTEYDILAKTFAKACKQFDVFGEDARDILCMEEREVSIHQGLTNWIYVLQYAYINKQERI